MKGIRKLNTILFADIVGYTSMMQKNEPFALRMMNQFRQTLEICVPQNCGSIIQYFGDGCLLSFDSVTDGMTCALELQSSWISSELPARIGVHIGEVLYRDNNAFGDGVNIASRIESLGIPGSVLLSSGVRAHIKNRPQFSLLEVGLFEFKNVEEPMLVYALANPGLVIPVRGELTGKTRQGKEKTIAVLPFNNLSSDPEQQYFSDGLTEEIITDLSKIADLKVISRTSVMGYRNTGKTLKVIGKELGAQYIMEGGVRKSGKRIRITAQLIDAKTDQYLWAEKYDGTLDDIFDLQESVSLRIVSFLTMHLTNKELREMTNRGIELPEAYDLYLQALSDIRKPTEASLQRAKELVDRASKLIGENEILLRVKGQIHLTFLNLGLKPDRAHAAEADRLVDRIFAINRNSIEGTFLKAQCLIQSHYFQEGASLLKQVLDQRPNDIEAVNWMIIVLMETGQIDLAYPYIQHILTLDPQTGFNHCFLGWYYLSRGRINDSIRYYARAFQLDSSHPFVGFFYASVLPLGGEKKLAVRILEQIETFPEQLIMAHLAGFLKFALLEQYEDAMSKLTDQLKEQAVWNSNTCFQMGRIFGLLSEKKEMLHWLNQAVEKGFYNDMMMMQFPAFLPFQTDPDFLLVRKNMQNKREKVRI